MAATSLAFDDQLQKPSQVARQYVGSIPGLGKSLGEGMATHSGILAWRIPWAADSAGYSLQGGEELDTTEQLRSSKNVITWKGLHR